MIQEQPVKPSSLLILWGLRLCTGVALGISIYLAWLSVSTGTTALGCDPGAGCEDVLTSSWSKWFGIPVALFAVMAYGMMFISSWCIGTRLQSAAWQILILGSTVAVGAAGWFAHVQYAILDSFCPYCLATHTAGILTAMLVLIGAPICWRLKVMEPKLIALSRLGLLIGIGLFVTGVLMFTGHESPQPNVTVVTEHPTETHTPPPSPPTPTPSPTTKPIEKPIEKPKPQPQADPNRVISILKGRVNLRLNENIILGNPKAPHIVVFLFDYTCPHCRIAHAQLELALKRYPSQFAILAIPFPLDADCNPLVPKTRPKHVYACELAQTVWSTWNVDPGALRNLDHWIAKQDPPPSAIAADTQANLMLKERGHLTPLKKLPIDQLLRRGVMIYRTAGSGPIPKIIFGEATINGPATSNQQLFRLLEEQLGLIPPAES